MLSVKTSPRINPATVPMIPMLAPLNTKMRKIMLRGASIGVVGTLAGFVLGVVFTNNIEAIRQFIQKIIGTDLFAAEIYFFTRIPARIDSSEVAAVVIMALMLSFLATLYPSWRAARLDPVEALRYE